MAHRKCGSLQNLFVLDHVTELRVAKSRVKELELVCTTQRSEVSSISSCVYVIVIAIMGSKFRKSYFKAECKIPAYSRALHGDRDDKGQSF